MRTARARLAVFVFTFLCLPLIGYTQESWEGNAALIRQGEFSGSGLYAASNSFPENTCIRVENVQTGKSVEVTVVKRIEGASNIFLLLSEQAGAQIGLSGSEVIRVRARVISSIGHSLEETLREQAYSSDPDLNPPLSVGEELLQPASEEAIAAGGSEAEEQPQTEGVARESEPGEAEAAAAQPAKSAEQKRLEEIANRVPQKHHYLPPRQQELYALAPPPEEAEEEAAAAEVPGEEQQPEPVEELAEAPAGTEEISAAAEEQPRVSMAVPSEEEQAVEVELPGPQTVEPEKPSPEGSRLPAPEGEEPLAMKPEVPPLMGEEQPPKEEGAVAEQAAEAGEQLGEVEEPAIAETIPPTGAELAQAGSLPARTYFVQLGAYSTRSLAEKLAGELNQTYSVTILPATSDGRRFFKVLVGPLNGDESGTLLYKFRARGFKDAFIQFVE